MNYIDFLTNNIASEFVEFNLFCDPLHSWSLFFLWGLSL